MTDIRLFRATARRWLALTLLLGLGLGLGLAVGGCTAKVDAQGNVDTGKVWFDADGNAHCPYCDTEIKLRTDGKGAVVPFSNVCPKGHEVVWAAETLPCPQCEGTGVCQTCKGSAIDPYTHKRCPDCIEIDENDLPVSTSHCSRCGGKGTVRYGWTGPNAIPH